MAIKTKEKKSNQSPPPITFPALTVEIDLPPNSLFVLWFFIANNVIYKKNNKKGKNNDEIWNEFFIPTIKKA